MLRLSRSLETACRPVWIVCVLAGLMGWAATASIPLAAREITGSAAGKPSASKAKHPASAAPAPAEPISGHPVARDPAAVARQVDQLITRNLQALGVKPAPLTTDHDFLRRISFDLAGTTPDPATVTLFSLNPDPGKRAAVIDGLLASEEYARNWSQYWREVIYSRATDPRARIAQGQFELWMRERLMTNAGWDKTVTELLTATGNVRENGATALYFAHQAEPEEVAAEVSRIFLGIQIQCANCHDHPTDRWKREQFHELAAYFPRVALRRDPAAGPLTFNLVSVDAGPARGRFADPAALTREPEKFISQVDRNGDGKITVEEVRNPQLKKVLNRLIERADTNKDGALSAAELKAMPLPNQPGRGSLEHYMPNLEDPSDRGQLMTAQFFLAAHSSDAGRPVPAGWTSNSSRTGNRALSDSERREAIARQITHPDNVWFAKAYVNRIWFELLGEGFYMPVDDIGPDRTAQYPEVLELLSQQFAAHDFDVKWLFRAIALTDTYQRALASGASSSDHSADVPPAFASASPMRLRADQLFDALIAVLDIDEQRVGRPRRQAGAALRRYDNSPRGQFNTVFGFDPSTPQDEITGTIPQALFLMNSPVLHNACRVTRQSRLGQILDQFRSNDDAIDELYLLVLSREPTDRERTICQHYLADVPSRAEGFEDLLWSLLNSTEFLTRR